MSDPAGGREAEIEAVARALMEAHKWPTGPHEIDREVARAAIAALDAVRSSGSAAPDTVSRSEVAKWLRDAPAVTGAAFLKAFLAARSPQSEDQEEAVTILRDWLEAVERGPRDATAFGDEQQCRARAHDFLRTDAARSPQSEDPND